MPNNRILLAMSGGVDSSVSAILLKEQGFDLIGATLRVFKPVNNGINFLDQAIKDASIVSVKMNFPYYVLNVEEEFNKKIINNFISEYRSGKTPNPCSLCNREIKWEILLRFAHELNCSFIATGHYARIEQLHNRYYISRAIDYTKDQSYFLWRLGQEQLKKTIFPLGNYMKNEIRNIALKHGFEKIVKKSESYNICFIPDGDYRKFLKGVTPQTARKRPALIITETGEVMGMHRGIENYTVGQKMKNENRFIESLYVSKIDSHNNLIIIGKQSNLLKKEIAIEHLHLTKYNSIPESVEIHSNLRYKGPQIKCRIHHFRNKIKVIFDEPVFAASPGQSIVFYEGKDLIGGAVIKE